jgi:MFS family permease
MPSYPDPIILGADDARGRALVPVLIFIGLLVAVVSSLGSPLVPTIASSYRVSLASAQWSLTIALLAGAVSAPVIGRLGDGPRRRTVLVAALGVLVAGSVLAALPIHAFSVLIIGRGFQGVGLALLPLVMSVARDHLEPARARSTLATLSVTAVVGVGLGYPVTGVIAQHFDFHTAFWLAAVLGSIAIALAIAVVPKSTHRHPVPFDLTGAILLWVGLGGLLIAISEGSDWGWVSGTMVGVGGGSILVLGGWVAHELRVELPLIDLRLMRHRTVLTANVTGALAGIGMYMLLSMIIRYVQTPVSIRYGLGASVVVSGFVLVPLSAASFTASKAATALGRWISPSRTLPIGVLWFAAALVMFASARNSLWEIFVVMAIAGAGIGSSFAVMPRMIVSAVSPEETASALSLNQVLRTVGFSIGSALSGTILAAHTPVGSVFPKDVGYTDTALISFGLLIVTAGVSILLPAREPKPAIVFAEEDALLVEESVDGAIAGVASFEEPELPNSSFLEGDPSDASAHTRERTNR